MGDAETTARVRRAGTPWRVQAYEVRGAGDPVRLESRTAEFDELVVGRWCHIEQMDTGTWWMNIGGVTLWVRADRDGRPKHVAVYGPGDYADAADGCGYSCTWTTPRCVDP